MSWMGVTAKEPTVILYPQSTAFCEVGGLAAISKRKKRVDTPDQPFHPFIPAKDCSTQQGH